MDIFHVILSTDNIIHVEYVIHRLSLLISDAESPTLVPVYVEPLGDEVVQRLDVLRHLVAVASAHGDAARIGLFLANDEDEVILLSLIHI